MSKNNVLTKLNLVIAVCVAMMLLISCGKGGATSGKKIKVTTTTTMLSDLVKTIGGDRVEVTGLMGEGVDPHLYSASAGDIEKLGNADIIVYGGLHLEGKMTEIFEKLTSQNKNILNVGDNPARIVKIEETIDGNAKIKKDSVRILNSKGEDITNNTNVVLKKDITDKKITAIIDKIDKDEKYKIVYDVIYDESETENTVKTISKVKGLNTEEKQKEDITNVNGSIKDTKIEISKESTKKEVKAGDINTYNVIVKNIGSYDARDTVVEDTLYRKC